MRDSFWVGNKRLPTPPAPLLQLHPPPRMYGAFVHHEFLVAMEFYALVNYISPPPGESHSFPKCTLCRLRSFPPVSVPLPQPTLVCPGLKPRFPTRISAHPLALAQLFDHRQMLSCFYSVSLSFILFSFEVSEGQSPYLRAAANRGTRLLQINERCPG